MNTISRLNCIHIEFREELRMIRSRPHSQERFRLISKLSDRLRAQTSEALSEGRILDIPPDFIVCAFGLNRSASIEAILSAWDSVRLMEWRDSTFGDLDAAEWRFALGVSRRLLFPFLPSLDTSSLSRYRGAVGLVVTLRLFISSDFGASLHRLPEAVFDLCVLLRVIEAIHSETPFSITPLKVPSILNWEERFSSKEIFRWHATGINAVPRIRVFRRGRVGLEFADPRTLERLRGLLFEFGEFRSENAKD